MVLRGMFGNCTGTLCDCVVFGEPLTAPVLSSSSRLGKARQALSLPAPHSVLIKSTLHRAKHDNGGKVGRLHSLSQEEEVPWCTFTCVSVPRWCCRYNSLHSWRRDSEQRHSRVAFPAIASVPSDRLGPAEQKTHLSASTEITNISLNMLLIHSTFPSKTKFIHLIS